jgi:hypothetical protein
VPTFGESTLFLLGCYPVGEEAIIDLLRTIAISALDEPVQVAEVMHRIHFNAKQDLGGEGG